MRRLRSGFLLSAALLSFAAAPALAAGGVVAGVAPPAPVVETVPFPPATGYVWQPGYWSWTEAQYVGVPGVYVAAPRPGAIWVAGHWTARSGAWVRVGGYWQR